MGSEDAPAVDDLLSVGSEVAVKTHYLGSWARGFEVAELRVEGYVLKRVSDGSVLASVVPFDEVRRTPM
jgi:hypothetical protein